MQRNEQRMMNNNSFLVFDEDMEKSLEFDNKITLSKKQMNRFFIENPELQKKMLFDKEKKQENNLDVENDIFKLLKKEVMNNYKLDEAEQGNLKQKLEIIQNKIKNFPN